MKIIFLSLSKNSFRSHVQGFYDCFPSSETQSMIQKSLYLERNIGDFCRKIKKNRISMSIIAEV